MKRSWALPVLISGLISLPLLLAVPASAVSPAAAPASPGPAKALTYEVHDVGALWLMVSNWGLLGSQPGSPASYAGEPSALWPAPGGVDHLFSAGLWVGGVVLGEKRVSTGQFESELRASSDPLDVIYATAMGAAGGNRYPWPDPDDDGDGLEDEDPLNGRDDDSDGLVDEDFAAISNQHFRCVLSDTTTEAALAFLDHEPLGIEVIQQSLQWSDPPNRDWIGFDFTIRNVGEYQLENVYIGFFADCDIGGSEFSQAIDDMAGRGDVDLTPGTIPDMPAFVGYMYDGDGDGGAAPGYLGLVLLDHSTDPDTVIAPLVVKVRSFQIMSAMQQFDDGGDPTSDGERYQLLSAKGWDGNTLPGQEGDYRLLIASGPFPSLAPGQELFYRVAMVAGAGLDGLLANAEAALRTYQGAAFDRDGDPATGVNGKELTVHWLTADDIVVSTLSGRLAAYAYGVGARVDLAANVADLGGLAVERRDGLGLVARRWAEADFVSVTRGPDGVRAAVLDEEAGGWPRTYVLLLEFEGKQTVLDELVLKNLPPSVRSVEARPNPFNPRLEIRYTLSRPGPVTLAVHDARGRLVRTVFAGTGPAGEQIAVWDGKDDAGRPAASGVYELRLRDESGLVTRSVTLVR